ncbi:SPOR domain-containing protein [Pseudomonas sp. D4002]|uniref:SPOR domain-containing protein n=1 Tax=Pseudomonas sp. D4002 TaxID=2738817 RepID=UPI0015A10DB5|nr:SPOR domain-containing protein [Pseudomonas sp. D4002]NWB20114.1 SPOR domain-containing protein [Pseudomonas sp. D4002]
MRGLAITALALAVTGCGGDIDRARTSVASHLKDPDSAKFRNERQVSDMAVCGEVNGKNMFGAYSGFAQFLAMKRPGGFDVIIDPDMTDRFAGSVCGYAKAETEAKTKIKAPQPAVEIPGVRWSVQLASVSSEETAEAISRDLASSGWTPYTTRRDGKSRVFVGPFSTRAEANSKMDELARKRALNGFVLRYQEPEVLSK